jgi:hypothetical protein
MWKACYAKGPRKWTTYIFELEAAWLKGKRAASSGSMTT